MKKLLKAIILSVLLAGNALPQMVQSNFTGVLVPQYMCSGTSTRMPYIFRATLTGLQPNSIYRYYTQACRYTDFGTTNSGAGNPVLINVSGQSFRYTTSTSLSNSASYDSLFTDTSGNFTGWFGFVNTGNARFTAGNYIFPSITLDSAGNGVTKYRFALNDSIFVLKYTDSAITSAGTGIYGISQANPKNVVSLFDNISNTGRPLAVAYVENAGIDTAVLTSLVGYYKDSVILRNGRWGSVIPNLLANGIRRVNVHSLLTGVVLNYNIDSNGIWPSGTNTVNPNGGSTNPIRLSLQDIILTAHNLNSIPSCFSLKQNYPNPFNPATNIQFSIPSEGKIVMRLFNVMGQEINILANGNYNRGEYTLSYNAAGMNSGVYFYSLEFYGKEGVYLKDTKKLILIK
jgi:hypothetical protein